MTHRKVGEAAQARLASIVALAQDSIVSFDFERRIVSWNQGAVALLGFTAAEAIGHDLATIVLTQEGRERESLFQDIEAGRPVEDFLTSARTKSGVRLDVSVSASPVMDQAGAVIGGSMILRDVSVLTAAERAGRERAGRERAGRERAGREGAEELASRAAQRTRDLVVTQEDERQRIARDLHDHLGQQITALRLSLAVCKERASGDDILQQQLASAAATATRLDADIEFLAWELRPSQLDKGLVTAIDAYAREWSKHFRVGIDIHTAPLDEGLLPPQAALNLYRIAQEALNNVAKHAHATRVAVILEQREGRAVLVIEDNGRGFDVRRKQAGPYEQRLGLSGMRERASLMSGTTDIESAPGQGTTVIVQIPMGVS